MNRVSHQDVMVLLELRKQVSTAIQANVQLTRDILQNPSTGDKAIMKASTDQVVNAYDTACLVYLSGGVDKGLFKTSFKTEILNLRAGQHGFEYSADSYQSISLVCDEWFSIPKDPEDTTL